MWQYDILLNPVTKKNSQQIIKVHGRNIIIPSAAYKRYEAQCGQYLQDRPENPINVPCEVTCLYFLQRTKKGEIPKRVPDLCNLMEATHDVLTKYKILEDDNSRIIWSVDGSRVYWTMGEPHTIVTITEKEYEDTESESGRHSDGEDSV